MLESKELGMLNPNNDLSYYAIHCPAPVKNRDFVLQVISHHVFLRYFPWYFSVTRVHLLSVFLMELFHLHFHISFTKFLIQRSWLQTPSESYIINHRCLKIWKMGFDSPFEHCEMRNVYKILLDERPIKLFMSLELMERLTFWNNLQFPAFTIARSLPRRVSSEEYPTSLVSHHRLYVCPLSGSFLWKAYKIIVVFEQGHGD